MDENKYGKLLNRLKAILIDGLVLIGLSLIASTVLAQFETVSNFVRAISSGHLKPTDF